MIFENELKKLGLKDKEAAVYLSCLELGPSPVQKISRKAKVVRATTYVILESLMNMGLVTKYKEGKKTLFIAEPPRQLMRLLEKSREELDEKQHDLEQLLPELHVLMKGVEGRPTVRYFSGREGLHAIRQEIVMYSVSGDVICNFTPTDYLDAIFTENENQYYQQRVAKGIKSRTIFTTKSQKHLDMLMSKDYTKLSQRRYIKPEAFPSTSGMTIFKDRIAIGTFTGKFGGVIIENQAMSEMMRRLFDIAWEGAKQFE